MAEAEAGWSYRCEGNSNVVIANREKSIIIRILKGATSDAEDGDRVLLNAKVQRIQRFIDRIVNPLMPHAAIPKVVELCPEFVKVIRTAIQKWRPDERKSKDIPTNTELALELPDFCFLPKHLASHLSIAAHPAFAVEIKPKMGYMKAFSSHLAISSADSPFPCFFCVTERFPKAGVNYEGHDGGQYTQYCPVDLFSGNRNRMMFALESLFDSFKHLPNRFRLYKRGTHVKLAGSPNLSVLQHREMTEEIMAPFFRNKNGKTSLKELLELVCSALLHSDAEHDQMPVCRLPSACRVPSLCEFSECPKAAGGVHSLPEDCILAEVISTLHRNGDTAETVYYDHYLPVIRRLVTDSITSSMQLHDKGVEGGHEDSLVDPGMLDKLIYDEGVDAFKGSVVQRLTAHHQQLPAESDCNCNVKVNDEQNDVSTQFLLKKVRDFLLSKTAKDCSVMITIQPLVNHTELYLDSREVFVLQDSFGWNYACHLALIDLDPKLPRKIPAYFTAYRRYLEWYTHNR